MKKKTKILALLIAVVMMCLCLGGCDELDDLKSKQAYWTNDKSIDSITYNGEIYKLLNFKETTPYTLYNLDYSLDNYINVTEKDVPVLLSNAYGSSLQTHKDGTFLEGYIYDPFNESNPTLYNNGRDVMYCKEELYDEISKTLEDGIKYTNYGYSTYSYDDTTDEEIFEYIYLSQEACDVINDVLENVEPEYTSYKGEFVVTLDVISEDKYFATTNYNYEIVYEYESFEKTYYITSFMQTTEDYTYYEIPQKYNEIFDEINENINDFEKTYAY